MTNKQVHIEEGIILSPAEQQILAAGGKYCLNTYNVSNRHVDQAVEDFVRRIRLKSQFQNNDNNNNGLHALDRRKQLIHIHNCNIKSIIRKPNPNFIPEKSNLPGIEFYIDEIKDNFRRAKHYIPYVQSKLSAEFLQAFHKD